MCDCPPGCLVNFHISYQKCVLSVMVCYVSFLCFQVERLEVPSSQDKVYVFLHRGAVVGGKEVLYTVLY